MDAGLLMRLAGAAGFIVNVDAGDWSVSQALAWVALVLAGLQVLDFLVLHGGVLTGLGARGKALVHRGLHLDHLETLDVVYILMNKVITSCFAYNAIAYMWRGTELIAWGALEPAGPEEWRISVCDGIASAVGAQDGVTPAGCTDAVDTALALTGQAYLLLSLYIAYDSTYCLLHRVLHARWAYAYVHKHHHRQASPSRGNTDALNVHPLEFALGEYNHLAAIAAVAMVAVPVLGVRLHAATAAVFVLLGGVLASLNHTRFDLSISVPVPSPIMVWGQRAFRKGRESVAPEGAGGVSDAADSRPAVAWLPLFSVAGHDVHHYRYLGNYSQYSLLWDVVFGWFVPPEASRTTPRSSEEEAAIRKQALALAEEAGH